MGYVDPLDVKIPELWKRQASNRDPSQYQQHPNINEEASKHQLYIPATWVERNKNKNGRWFPLICVHRYASASGRDVDRSRMLLVNSETQAIEPVDFVQREFSVASIEQVIYGTSLSTIRLHRRAQNGDEDASTKGQETRKKKRPTKTPCCRAALLRLRFDQQTRINRGQTCTWLLAGAAAGAAPTTAAAGAGNGSAPFGFNWSPLWTHTKAYPIQFS